MKKTAIFCLFLYMLGTCIGQENEYPIKIEQVIGFDSIDASSFKEIIQSIGKDATVVGLGEVSHYTKECYDLKRVAITELMKQGYAALILEVDFGQALIWNEYVLNGKGNLQNLLETSGWFTYRTQEFKELLEVIKNYNSNTSEKFQIFGMEMTAMHNNIAWLQTYLSGLPTEAEDIVTLLKKERQIVAFQNYSETERTDYWNLHYRLVQFLEDNRDELLAEKGNPAYETAMQIAEITRQYATYISQNDFGLKTEFRDQFSARNVLWALDQLPENSKLIVWSHNGHVAKTSPMYQYDVLGHYLNKWFGTDYVGVGFTFHHGSFGAFSNNGFKEWQMPKTQEKSLTHTFSKFETPYLFFDIREQLNKNSSVNFFLRNPVAIRTDISESYSETQNNMMEITLADCYDALIYIEETHYPTTIPYKPKK